MRLPALVALSLSVAACQPPEDPPPLIRPWAPSREGVAFCVPQLEYLPAVRAGIEEWEVATNLYLGYATGDEPDGCVPVRYVDRVKGADDVLGQVVGVFTKRAIYVEIERGTSTAILLHELGHVWGLWHELDGADSIMTPAVGDDQVITEQDVETLRALYGR